MKYLGIDYGTRWVGFSLGNDETGMALPFKTAEVKNEQEALTICRALIQEESIDACVVGIPQIGAHTIDTKPILDFIKKLSEEISIPIYSADESFSSKQAQGLLGNSAKDNHSLAAMVILQSYLDYHRHDNME